MESIVLDLQKEAYKSDTSITVLLRKAYVVARKLGVKEFEKWINDELYGYHGDYNDIPKYRIVIGEVKGMNPYNGSWTPILIEDDELDEILRSRKLTDKISNIEALIDTEGSQLTMKYNNALRRKLSELIGYETKFQFFFNKTQANSIIDSVRNIILKWTLKLEDEGIIGEDMTFSKDEKNKASSIITNNFFGDINNSQLQQNTKDSYQAYENIDFNEVKELSKMIKENLSSIEMKTEKSETIIEKLDEIERCVKNKNSKRAVDEIFISIKNILEGAGGSIIASGLIYQIGQFLSH